jgi:hypothetical protein
MLSTQCRACQRADSPANVVHEVNIVKSLPGYNERRFSIGALRSLRYIFLNISLPKTSTTLTFPTFRQPHNYLNIRNVCIKLTSH